VLITTPFWPVYLDRDRLDRTSDLKLVITAGVGSDHVGSEAAVERGVTVTEVTGSNVVSVAEHNVLLILALVRNFVPAHEQVAEGRWDVTAAAQDAHDLEGRTVGLIGLGAIGARTALRLKAFDVTMLYSARHRRSPAEEAVLGVRFARLDDLVARSDVVCAALPRLQGSRALFDRERLAAMKSGSCSSTRPAGPSWTPTPSSRPSSPGTSPGTPGTPGTRSPLRPTAPGATCPATR
jgi:formate dehydrogenase